MMRCVVVFFRSREFCFGVFLLFVRGLRPLPNEGSLAFRLEEGASPAQKVETCQINKTTIELFASVASLTYSNAPDFPAGSGFTVAIANGRARRTLATRPRGRPRRRGCVIRALSRPHDRAGVWHRARARRGRRLRPRNFITRVRQNAGFKQRIRIRRVALSSGDQSLSGSKTQIRPPPNHQPRRAATRNARALRRTNRNAIGARTRFGRTLRNRPINADAARMARTGLRRNRANY